MSTGGGSLANLARLGDGVRSRRWSSFDTTGGNADSWPIPAGETVTLGGMQGAGCVRHIWMTTSEADNNLRRLILRMYWDGAEVPSVEVPLGDFFAVGNGMRATVNSLPVKVSSYGRGLNCYA